MKHLPLKIRQKTIYNVRVSVRGRYPFLIMTRATAGAGRMEADTPSREFRMKKKGERKMRKYTKNGELEAVICNHCAKKLAVKDGIVREGVLMIDHAWDYFSEKDGEVHHLDLCEECYDQLIQGLRLPVDIEERTELL